MFQYLLKLEFEWKKAAAKTKILPKAEKTNVPILFEIGI